MAPNEVIDLLSSDSEIANESIKPAEKRPAQRSRNAKDACLSEDETDVTLDLDEAWTTHARKWRRISSPHIEPSLPLVVNGSHNLERTTETGLPDYSNRSAFDEDDPIVFTSSLPHTTTRSRPRAERATQSAKEDISSDDSLPDDILGTFRPNNNIASLSARTESLLASLGESRATTKLKTTRQVSPEMRNRSNGLKTHKGVVTEDISDNEGLAKSRSKNQSQRTTKLSEEERQAREKEKERAKEARARERELAKERRAQTREEEKERKRLLREDKAEEKRKATNIAEVNKSKVDKKDSTREMIVDLPVSLSGSDVEIQVQEHCKNLNVDTTLYQSTVPNVIKWRRKTKAQWNAHLEHWEPLPSMVIKDENHILCLLPASEFVALAKAPPSRDENLETHTAKLKSAYEGSTPIYMIEGLKTLINRSKNAENRAYQAQVLGQDLQRNKRKRAATAAPLVDEKGIENALLRLQVLGGCYIHHTALAKDSAEWISNFTQHISTIPYRWVYHPFS